MARLLKREPPEVERLDDDWLKALPLPTPDDARSVPLATVSSVSFSGSTPRSSARPGGAT